MIRNFQFRSVEATPVNTADAGAPGTEPTAADRAYHQTATGWDARGRMYRHNVDAAMRVGTRFADRCWELHPQLEPSHNERVISALVLAAAAAVDDEDLAYVGVPTDVSYLDVALAVAGGKGDRVSQTLLARVAKRSKTWTQALEGWMDVPFEHRAMLSVAVQTVIAHAVQVRDAFAANVEVLGEPGQRHAGLDTSI